MDVSSDKYQNLISRTSEAVSDANKTIQLSPLLAKAYLRKGTAFIKLEEYQTAKVALQIGASFAPDDSRFTKLIQDCDRYIAEESKDSTDKCRVLVLSTKVEIRMWVEIRYFNSCSERCQKRSESH
ncbi:protein SGT1 homolog B-like [Arachis ipaensis]|uniref:protein SGT1 homolog B-like n=1 Tax=Arachis ipaensis TaxID=130454 RepID=UPI0007AF64EA|nr:protein SGT1 homolog B-like [Arachis ipaensis]XP_025679203.1 protein SGT1 homolog B-like [Arachis hypogaea]